MTILLFKLAGGIGLFLLGMVLLTDGLKAFAGNALRNALVRFTGTPLKAFASGTAVTVLVQSSSATTVTVIGFVSAGLLAFPQALGVVMGASLGTTGTGWIVAVLGLKISVGFYALPLVGAGAFMNLLGKGRWRSLGLALAGFGIIFLGIQTLQEGMGGLSDVFDLAAVPSTGFWGHVLMMLIGILLTVIMQSSSAAVATTLTALHTASINFDQAASLVIGSAIGTTVTGAIAAIGGSVPAKRTALAHVLFNLGTGLIAVLLLPLFLKAITWAQEHAGLDPGATSLAAFHTAFIALGVLVFLPFVNHFARWIERMLPDTGAALTRHLDQSLLSVPGVAIEATGRALRETSAELFSMLDAFLKRNEIPQGSAREAAVSQALDRLQEFLTKIPSIDANEPASPARVSQLHAIDHLIRLKPSLHPLQELKLVLFQPELKECRELTISILRKAGQGLREESKPDWIEEVERTAHQLSELRRSERPAILEQTANGRWEAKTALVALDAMRWLDAIGYHVWRTSRYLGVNTDLSQASPEREQSDRQK